MKLPWKIYPNMVAGPLTDELKRAVIEIKIGSTFEDAFLGMGERLKSKTLDRTFRMIIEGRRVGGSLADVIETVAEDLRAVLALQRERRANVMMSVMFLLIAAVIAAPFALGMIMSYSAFIESLRKTQSLIRCCCYWSCRIHYYPLRNCWHVNGYRTLW